MPDLLASQGSGSVSQITEERMPERHAALSTLLLHAAGNEDVHKGNRCLDSVSGPSTVMREDS